MRFTGITPDLFRENSGVVAEGRFQPDGRFVATEILAKHDENYMPPRLGPQGDQHKTETLEMIAEGGLAALWLAAALSLLQLFLGVAAPARGRRDAWRCAVRPVAVAQGVLAGVAFLMLIWLFLRTDLSVQLVAANSHSAKPWLYKFAGAWGNHEGSMLLWVTVLALAGAVGRLVRAAAAEEQLIATLAAQASIGLGFYAFLLFASNPFTRLDPGAGRGQRPQPAATGPGPGLPPADPLFRLCRHLDRFLLRGRRARHPRCRRRPSRGRCGLGCSARGSS